MVIGSYPSAEECLMAQLCLQMPYLGLVPALGRPIFNLHTQLGSLHANETTYLDKEPAPPSHQSLHCEDIGLNSCVGESC